VTHNSTHGLISLFSRNVTYDPLLDFTCIAPLAGAANALSVNASLPIRSVANLVACARSGPQGVQVGIFGIARPPSRDRTAADPPWASFRLCAVQRHRRPYPSRQ